MHACTHSGKVSILFYRCLSCDLVTCRYVVCIGYIFPGIGDAWLEVDETFSEQLISLPQEEEESLTESGLTISSLPPEGESPRSSIDSQSLSSRTSASNGSSSAYRYVNTTVTIHAYHCCMEHMLIRVDQTVLFIITYPSHFTVNS